MRIAKDRVVSIDYIIRVDDGEVVESSTEGPPLTYLHGRAQIVAGVEKAIEGAESGEVREVIIGPKDGFGERDPGAVFRVPRRAFPSGEEVETGMTFTATRLDGQTVLFRVLEADREMVLIDTNHPLAGRLLRVWVAVRTVRAATSEELLWGRPKEHEERLPQ